MRGSWWRIDSEPPHEWRWHPFPAPRNRFDPVSGRFRLRYAASDPTAAARERFPSRALTEAHGALWLTRLEVGDRRLAALHLTRRQNLDALGLDDRVSTGRLDDVAPGGDPLLSIGQALADAVFDWWDARPPPLVYRTRTTPAARSLAFGSHIAWASRAARPLREAPGLLVALVTRHGFTVPDHWLH